MYHVSQSMDTTKDELKLSQYIDNQIIQVVLQLVFVSDWMLDITVTT